MPYLGATRVRWPAITAEIAASRITKPLGMTIQALVAPSKRRLRSKSSLLRVTITALCEILTHKVENR
jgi:hypothetical protein